MYIKESFSILFQNLKSQIQKRKQLIFGVILGVFLCFAATAIAYFSYIKSLKIKEISVAQNNTQPRITGVWELPNNTSTSTINTVHTEFAPINWLSEPKKIASLEIFDKQYFNIDEEEFILEDATFYQIASYSNDVKLINVYLPYRGPGGDTLIRIINTSDKNYIVTSLTEEYVLDNDFVKYFSKNVEFTDQKINDLIAPSKIIINNNIDLEISGNTIGSSYKFSEIENPQKIFDTEFGPIYKGLQNVFNGIDQNQLGARSVFLKFKDGTVVFYYLKSDLLGDGLIPKITWKDGSENVNSYMQNLISSCSMSGSDSYPIINPSSFLLDGKVEVGKTSSNTPVYQIVSENNLALKEFYKFYQSGRSEDSNTLSYEQFIKVNNNFIWQDSLGDWQIFLNEEYAPMAECGKPVIYLYPPKETQVRVQVAAQISKSEPLYPQNGWLVNAKSNGELTYQNQTYPYLFWEGLGHGSYPDYRNRGVVVSQKDLRDTLYSQLSLLGLNNQESADFMDFWQNKLPTSPYVRLTWLGTKDMDELAPLTVNPLPDTKIRIFLEFEALNKPVNLIPQILSAPKRTGFTLVEWGGLLISSK